MKKFKVLLIILALSFVYQTNAFAQDLGLSVERFFNNAYEQTEDRKYYIVQPQIEGYTNKTLKQVFYSNDKILFEALANYPTNNNEKFNNIFSEKAAAILVEENNLYQEEAKTYILTNQLKKITLRYNIVKHSDRYTNVIFEVHSDKTWGEPIEKKYYAYIYDDINQNLLKLINFFPNNMVLEKFSDFLTEKMDLKYAVNDQNNFKSHILNLENFEKNGLQNFILTEKGLSLIFSKRTIGSEESTVNLKTLDISNSELRNLGALTNF